MVLVALVAGAALTRVPETSPAPWLLAAPLFVALVFFVLQGPKWCLAAIIASLVFGLSKYSFSAGGVDLRVSDVFYVALGVWVVLLRWRDGQRGYLIGRRVLALWLLAAGFSLYPLLVQGTAPTDSVIGWLRLVATFTLVWFVPYALRTVADVEFTLGVLALATTTEVGASALIGIAHGDFVDRLSGANGKNGTGLLAALILVLAVHGPVPRRRSYRYTMLVVGAVGLLMTTVARSHRGRGRRAGHLRAPGRVQATRPVADGPDHTVTRPDHAPRRSRRRRRPPTREPTGGFELRSQHHGAPPRPRRRGPPTLPRAPAHRGRMATRDRSRSADPT